MRCQGLCGNTRPFKRSGSPAFNPAYVRSLTEALDDSRGVVVQVESKL
jgi:hypothetical protein